MTRASRLFQLAAASSLVALAAGGYATAQEAPRSILPPGFGTPAPSPSPTATPAPTPAPNAPSAPRPTSDPSGAVVQPIGPDTSEPSAPPPPPSIPQDVLAGLPSVEELESLSTDELDERLGLKPRIDIPEAVRRSTDRIGFLSAADGGLSSQSLANQDPALVRAVMNALDGPVVSRWGHILLRRALVSRLAAPGGMDPVTFAAYRVRALNSMGEYAAGRALAQSVDTAEWNQSFSNVALQSYLGVADILGACPATNVAGASGESVEWQMLAAICNAYEGETTRAQSDLNRMRRGDNVQPIDVLLAQRYAGAAGQGRRAFNIEWDDVDSVTPWRYALANALGEPIPDNLAESAPASYRASQAFMPNLSPDTRIGAASEAALRGVLSSSAMVDLYSEAFTMDEPDPAFSGPARQLRTAYVDPEPSARLAAIEAFWDGSSPAYDRLVTTAYAAGRMTPQEAFADRSGMLIASMLAAGLDRNALRWKGVVKEGSLGSALLSIADPAATSVSRSTIDSFIDDDGEGRASQFYLAGLAGLGRVDEGTLGDFSSRLNVDLTPRTRWSKVIEAAGRADNQAMVVLLAGLGMRGENWEAMTPRHLYSIVSALNAVGLSAEARMIAAEAVARA